MSSTSGAVGQDKTWRAKEQGDEAQYIREKEQAHLTALRAEAIKSGSTASDEQQRDFEGGFGGQEDLEDRYATTCGEH